MFADPYVSVDTLVENPDFYRGRIIQVKGNFLSGSLTMTSDNVTLIIYGENQNTG